MNETIVNAINLLIKGVDLANRKGVFGIDEAGEIFNAKMEIIKHFDDVMKKTEVDGEKPTSAELAESND